MKYAIVAAAAAGVVVAAPGATTTSAEWEPYTTTTTTAEWEPYTTTTSEWEPYTTTSKSTEWEAYTTTSKTTEWEAYTTTYSKPCSYLSTYTTTECGTKTEDWDNCKAATKTSTVYPESCTAWSTWAPIAETSSYCTYTTTYTTTECGAKTQDWDNCKVATKTETKTTDTCTWGGWTSTTSKPVEASTTWAPVEYSTKEAASTAWAPIASTTKKIVATYSGAADRQAVGMGAIAAAFFLAAL